MTINNKELGNDFEKEFLQELGKLGFWAHFIEPNKQGAQPFDIIAIRHGEPYAFDCKTCIRSVFGIKRLEINQMTAFNKIINHGCRNVYLAVLHDNRVHLVKYEDLLKYGSVDLNESNLLEQIIY